VLHIFDTQYTKTYYLRLISIGKSNSSANRYPYSYASVPGVQIMNSHVLRVKVLYTWKEHGDKCVSMFFPGLQHSQMAIICAEALIYTLRSAVVTILPAKIEI
jgi:hypothetical protein